LLAFARFALHVVDRVFVPNVGIKAKDHLVQAFPGPVAKKVETGSSDETTVKPAVVVQLEIAVPQRLKPQ
jgi:hypothetical protein